MNRIFKKILVLTIALSLVTSSPAQAWEWSAPFTWLKAKITNLLWPKNTNYRWNSGTSRQSTSTTDFFQIQPRPVKDSLLMDSKYEQDQPLPKIIPQNESQIIRKEEQKSGYVGGISNTQLDDGLSQGLRGAQQFWKQQPTNSTPIENETPVRGAGALPQEEEQPDIEIAWPLSRDDFEAKFSEFDWNKKGKVKISNQNSNVLVTMEINKYENEKHGSLIRICWMHNNNKHKTYSLQSSEALNRILLTIFNTTNDVMPTIIAAEQKKRRLEEEALAQKANDRQEELKRELIQAPTPVDQSNLKSIRIIYGNSDPRQHSELVVDPNITIDELKTILSNNPKIKFSREKQKILWKGQNRECPLDNQRINEHPFYAMDKPCFSVKELKKVERVNTQTSASIGKSNVANINTPITLHKNTDEIEKQKNLDSLKTFPMFIKNNDENNTITIYSSKKMILPELQRYIKSEHGDPATLQCNGKQLSIEESCTELNSLIDKQGWAVVTFNKKTTPVVRRIVKDGKVVHIITLSVPHKLPIGEDGKKQYSTKDCVQYIQSQLRLCGFKPQNYAASFQFTKDKSAIAKIYVQEIKNNNKATKQDNQPRQKLVELISNNETSSNPTSKSNSGLLQSSMLNTSDLGLNDENDSNQVVTIVSSTSAAKPKEDLHSLRQSIDPSVRPDVETVAITLDNDKEEPETLSETFIYPDNITQQVTLTYHPKTNTTEILEIEKDKPSRKFDIKHNNLYTTNESIKDYLLNGVILGKIEWVKFLLEKCKADPNTTFKNEKRIDGKISYSPLLSVLAIYHNDKNNLSNMASLLISHGANPNTKDIHIESPLMTSIRAIKPDLVELFITKGADIEEKGLFGTPLTCAVNVLREQLNNTETVENANKITRIRHIIKKLQQAGAQINADITLLTAHAPINKSLIAETIFEGVDVNPALQAKLVEQMFVTQSDETAERRAKRLQEKGTLNLDKDSFKAAKYLGKSKRKSLSDKPA